MKRLSSFIALSILLITIAGQSALAQSTEFTYQGRLLDNSLPPTANYDFEFSLWDSLVAGSQQGTTQTVTGVAVANGIFTVKLNFGAQFSGPPRFLQIAMRAAGGGAYTTLAPRQPFSSAPYAIKSLNATNADTATTANNALNLGGVAASQYVVTTDPRMTDERNPTPGSSNYIQNQNAGPQASSNFNVSGTGTANIFSATTQYNIGANRILSTAGNNNLFAGVGAGAANPGGQGFNSFFGRDSGQANTDGSFNSFFGARSGRANTVGENNAFFGVETGRANETGGYNSFFGVFTGSNNTTGFDNSFFGVFSGTANTTGRGNTNIGFGANLGADNLTNATALGARALAGASNSLVLGSINGVNFATADTNVGIGTTTPTQRLHVVGNALFANDLTVSGTLNANLSAGSITSGTLGIARGGTGLSSSGAAGNYLRSDGTNWTSSALQTGDIPGGSGSYIQNQNAGPQSSSSFNVSGTGTANIFSATTQYNIGGSRILSNAGTNNVFAGVGAGNANTGGDNSFFGAGSGSSNQTGNFNSFFGASSGVGNQTGGGNSFFGANSGVVNQTGGDNAFFGTQSGGANQNGSENSFFGSRSGNSNQTGFGNSFFGIRSGQANTTGSFNTTIGSNANVGAANLDFATAIGALSVVSSSNTIALGRSTGADKVVIPGLGAGGDTALCRNAGNQVATCSGLSVPEGSSNYIQNQNAGPQSSSNFNISGTGTANIFSATTQYNIGTSRVLSNAGANNLFAGVGAGNANTGGDNSFFGAGSGSANQVGNFNSFFGTQSGQTNQTGNNNSFFGSFAGEMTTASDNTFFGYRAGDANTIGFRNTIIGSFADVVSGPVSNATAIGYRAYVDQGNSIVLGSINGVNGATSDTRVGVGTTAPVERLHVVGNGRVDGNFYVGAASGGGNIGVGTTAPQSRLHVDGTGWFSGDTTPLSGAAGSGVAVGMTATSGYLFGFDYAAFTPRDMTINLPGGNVGIGIAPSDKLHVGGIIRVDTLGAAGSTQLCRNASNQIATCSSSLRYKTNIARFSLGLSFVNRLNPISYDWKDGGMKDVGFGAEDIATIDPRFVTFNAAGEVEGVKYDRLSVAFVNAFKEQQTEISELRAASSEQAEKIKDQNSKIEAQQKQLDALKKLVCLQNPAAEVCKEEK